MRPRSSISGNVCSNFRFSVFAVYMLSQCANVESIKYIWANRTYSIIWRLCPCSDQKMPIYSCSCTYKLNKSLCEKLYNQICWHFSLTSISKRPQSQSSSQRILHLTKVNFEEVYGLTERCSNMIFLRFWTFMPKYRPQLIIKLIGWSSKSILKWK